jgi:hypothetical protein
MWGSEASPAARTRQAHLALWVLVAVAGAWLVRENWNLWFGGDDWFILLDRRLSPGAGQLGIFEPHNEHWSTVPILAFHALYAIFGLASYWPYVVLLVAVHLSIVVLLWHVMVRADIDPWLALGFVAVVAVPGVGFENLANVWQVQLISPLALGLGALLVLPERGSLGARDGAASLLLTVGMACSGLGITMLGVVGLVASVRRGPRVAMGVVVLPALAYAWWYAAYGRDAPDVTVLSYRAVPGFVWDGLTDALGDVVRLRALGVVIVLATAAWLIWQLTRRPVAPTLLVPAALAVGAVVSLALTGWRRAEITVPSLPRYAYITIVLVLPIVAAATDWLVRRALRTRGAPVATVATAVVLLAIVVAQVRMFDRWVTFIEPVKRVEKALFLNTAAIARDGRLILNDLPMSVYEPQVTVAKIAAADQAGKLPSLDRLPEADRYTALARLQLVLAASVLPGIHPDPGSVRLGAVRGARVTPVEGRSGCFAIEGEVHPTVKLITDGGVAVGLRGDGRFAQRVERADGRVRGLDVSTTLDPAADQVFNIGPIDGGAVVFTLPPGTTTLCGVSPPTR